MDLRLLFDQNQFINPLMPLSGHGFLIPDVNIPWEELALTVESAQPRANRNLPPCSYQNFAQHNNNPSSAHGTRQGFAADVAIPNFWLQRVLANKLLLDDWNHALPSQGRQGVMLRSINDASIQPYHGPRGSQESICRNHCAYQPPAPSDGAHFASGANVLHGTPAVPATMEMAASTGNGTPSKRHCHLGFQAANAHPPSDGLIQLGRSPESSTDVGGTAYSSFSHSVWPLSDPWATAFDVSVSRPTAQAVASQMNIVTPYTSYGHDGGGTPAGAAVCVAASSTPGPTRNFIGACGTASSDRSGAVECHRSPYMCYDQTHLKVSTRRATRPSQSRTTRGAVVQFEADANTLATRLLNEGADSTAVEFLSNQVFNNGVSARALTVKSGCREQSTNTSSTRSNYRRLLADVERKDGSKGYCCLLCPQGRRKEYKNPQDSIRHLRKAHLGITESCIGGWYVAISRVKPSSKGN